MLRRGVHVPAVISVHHTEVIFLSETCMLSAATTSVMMVRWAMVCRAMACRCPEVDADKNDVCFYQSREQCLVLQLREGARHSIVPRLCPTRAFLLFGQRRSRGGVSEMFCIRRKCLQRRMCETNVHTMWTPVRCRSLWSLFWPVFLSRLLSRLSSRLSSRLVFGALCSVCDGLV